MTAAIATGYERSRTLRSLVDRIERSYAIVYVQIGKCPERQKGCFLHTAAGSGPDRYLQVVVADSPDESAMLAIIGHELQHVVEAIDAGAQTSRDLWWVNRRTGDMSRATETVEARAAGDAVLRELKAHARGRH